MLSQLEKAEAYVRDREGSLRQRNIRYVIKT